MADFITIPLGLTASPFTKTAISLPELVRQTNQFSKRYRPGCAPRLLDSNPRALFLHYNVKCDKEDSDPAGHDVRVQFDVTKVQETQKAKDLDVQVSCSCPAFLYWGAQWNLHQRDGLLGPARPALQAPKERLDLRGNFVICKHVHAVFERILPSVQHNIVNILRKRRVEENKRRMERAPELLQKEKERAEKRDRVRKVRETKNEGIKRKLLDALRREEEARMEHERELEDQVPGAVERTEPATAPAPKPAPKPEPEWTRLPKHYQPRQTEEGAIGELTDEEEERIEEAHREGKPHMHRGLPYEAEGGKKSSLKTAGEPGLLFRSPETPDRSNDYHPEQDADSYPIDKRPPAELARMATEVCRHIYEDLKRKKVIDTWMFGFEVWACDLSQWGAVATYINGTYDFPVILIDLRQHSGYEDQIGKTIWHELKHAEQQSRGEEGFDEDEAEDA